MKSCAKMVWATVGWAAFSLLFGPLTRGLNRLLKAEDRAEMQVETVSLMGAYGIDRAEALLIADAILPMQDAQTLQWVRDAMLLRTILISGAEVQPFEQKALKHRNPTFTPSKKPMGVREFLMRLAWVGS